jgi:predicted nucleotidyltransferase
MHTTSHLPITVDNSATYLAQVRQIVLDQLKGYTTQVYLFGSRARGEAGANSDIDVGIWPTEPLPSWVLSEVRETLFESLVPFQVDVIDLSQTDENFRQRVLKEAIAWND